MQLKNNMTEFILLGLTQDPVRKKTNPKLQKVIFVVVLVVYIISVVGNLFIMDTIIVRPLLSSPMYFFLAYLSLIDACYSSVNTPKLIIDSLHERKTILFNGCMTQIFGEHFLGSAEAILLTVMAYDCYVAICKPLHHTSIMNWRVFWLLIGVAWVGGFLYGLTQIFFIFRLPFCGPNVIDHFLCDLNPLLNLACTDTHTLGLFVAAKSGFICLINFILLMGSYVVILHSLWNHSLEGEKKALSTCSSHITVVVLFFVPCIYSYVLPAGSKNKDKNISVFYAVIAPMLNPLIYTLRNMEMKIAMRNVWSKVTHSGLK
ncbi:unnamed protein product [Rangifer tarandus platyrhynchus]|uniref:G-protein coupled receptors family 1 profile domain-containing protein n=1 Tax=Rangifer tarandus platyrhynchus TaxID=3082113 RepID=A0ABN8ZJ01_RANTA|nr:unnamed protein product [Rangifer tarandus platyrhynchus]